MAKKTKIKILRSVNSGNTPSLDSGEIGINEFDGILYYRDVRDGSARPIWYRAILPVENLDPTGASLGYAPVFDGTEYVPTQLAAASDYVAKAGDTMSGDLTLSRPDATLWVTSTDDGTQTQEPARLVLRRATASGTTAAEKTTSEIQFASYQGPGQQYARPLVSLQAIGREGNELGGQFAIALSDSSGASKTFIDLQGQAQKIFLKTSGANRVVIDSDGRFLVGITQAAGKNVYFNKQHAGTSGASTQLFVGGSIGANTQSGTEAAQVRSELFLAGNAGNSYNLSRVSHFIAQENSGGISADASLNEQVGFYITGLSAATSNRGLRIGVNEAANQTNHVLYCDGDAPSYFNGNIGIGVTVPNSPLSVAGPLPQIRANTIAPQSTASHFYIYNKNGSDHALIVRDDNAVGVGKGNSGNIKHALSVKSAKEDADGNFQISINSEAVYSNLTATTPGDITTGKTAYGYRHASTANNSSLAEYASFIDAGHDITNGGETGNYYSFHSAGTNPVAGLQAGFYSEINTSTGGDRYAFLSTGTAPSSFGGPVGIGESDLDAGYNVYADRLIVKATTDAGMTFRSSQYNTIAFADGAPTGNLRGYVQYAHNDDTLRIGTNNATRIHINALGSVGIGTTEAGAFSPNFNKLVIGGGTGQAGATIFSTTQGTLAFGDTATDGVNGYMGYVTYFHNASAGTEYAADRLTFGTNATQRMHIHGNGQVAIHATAYMPPAEAKLHVANDGASVVVIQGSRAGTTAIPLVNGAISFRNFQFNLDAQEGNARELFRIEAVSRDQSMEYGQARFLLANAVGDTTEYARIDPFAGYFRSELKFAADNFTTYAANLNDALINLSGDELKLNSGGLTSLMCQGARVWVGGRSSNSGRSLVFPNAIGTDTAGQTSVIGGSQGTGTGTGGALSFATAPAGTVSGTDANARETRMTILGNGKVGINTIDPASTLDVNGVITVSATAGSTGSYLPSVCFASDANTGLGQVGGADSVSLITAGSERVQVDSSGRVGIGASPTAAEGIRLGQSLTGGTGANGFLAAQTVLSDVTSGANVFRTFVGTEAAPFTLGLLSHFRASINTFGSGSTVTTHIGFQADNTLTEGTNNYGFRGDIDIEAGSGRWNFYALGTAPNYFNGNVGIGTTTPGALLDVDGDAIVSGNLTVNGTLTGSTSSGQVSGDLNVTGNTTIAGDLFLGGAQLSASATPTDYKPVKFMRFQLQPGYYSVSGQAVNSGTINSIRTVTVTAITDFLGNMWPDFIGQQFTVTDGNGLSWTLEYDTRTAVNTHRFKAYSTPGEVFATVNSLTLQFQAANPFVVRSDRGFAATYSYNTGTLRATVSFAGGVTFNPQRLQVQVRGQWRIDDDTKPFQNNNTADYIMPKWVNCPTTNAGQNTNLNTLEFAIPGFGPTDGQVQPMQFVEILLLYDYS